jgi:hypothetical protein
MGDDETTLLRDPDGFGVPRDPDGVALDPLGVDLLVVDFGVPRALAPPLGRDGPAAGLLDTWELREACDGVPEAELRLR